MSDQAVTKRQKYLAMWSDLDGPYTQVEGDYRQINRFIFPVRSQWLTTQNPRPAKPWAMLNSTPLQSVGTFGAGMMAGVCGPSRPWLRLEIGQQGAASPAAKQWVETVTSILLGIFARSNYYQVQAALFETLGAYGTACAYMEEDPEKVIRCQLWPIGSFRIGEGVEHRVNRIVRKITLTLQQCIDKFGFEALSPTLQGSARNGNRELSRDVEIIHAILPNDLYVEDSLDATKKRYTSCYIEASGNHGGVLRESGYDSFPAFVPRWSTDGQSPYAMSWPGLAALAESRQLQQLERRYDQAISAMTGPPIVAPTRMRQGGLRMSPFEINYFDLGPAEKVQSLYEIRLPIEHLAQKIVVIEDRLRRAMLEDVFQMLADLERDKQMTAEEIRYIRDSKMTRLGPALERIDYELLGPQIDVAYSIALRAGIIPDPPEEIQGEQVVPQFVSIAHQAQRAIATRPIESFLHLATTAVAVTPSAVDKIDGDKLIEAAGEMLGVPAKTVRTDEDVQTIRESRQRQAMAATATEMASRLAPAAQQLSETRTGTGSALDQLQQAVTGAAQ